MAAYYVALIIYISVLFIISIFLIRKVLNSFQEYGYCGRSLSIGFVFFTYLGTWIGGGTLIGLLSQSYSYGANQYWIIALSCIVEAFFALLFISRIRANNFKSITDFFAARFPDNHQIIRIPVTGALLIRNVSMIAMQFSALSYLLTYVFGISRNLALLLVFLVLIAYTVLSGLWGVTITDAFQGILQTVCIVVLVVLTLKITGGVNTVESYYITNDNSAFLNLFHTNSKWYEIILYIIAYGAFFLMDDQTCWERIYASKSDKTAKWGFIIPLIVTMLTLIVVSYLGVFQREIFNGEDLSESVLYKFIFDYSANKWMIIVLIGLIAAIMSSADSFLLTSGVIISEDIVKKFIIRDISDKEMIFFSRIFILVTGSMAFAFALNIDDILGLWITGIGMASIILLPGYFLGWIGRRGNAKSALIGMCTGYAYVACMFFGIIGNGPGYVCIGMALNLMVCLCAPAERALNK